MRDAKSVITAAVKGIVDKLQSDYEVSESRIYEMLSTDCTYPKTKRLIRAIGRHNPDGAKLIRADLDAMFAEIFGSEEIVSPSDAELAKELSDVFLARLEGKTKAERLHECREALEVITREIAAIEKDA